MTVAGIDEDFRSIFSKKRKFFRQNAGSHRVSKFRAETTYSCAALRNVWAQLVLVGSALWAINSQKTLVIKKKFKEQYRDKQD